MSTEILHDDDRRKQPGFGGPSTRNRQLTELVRGLKQGEREAKETLKRVAGQARLAGTALAGVGAALLAPAAIGIKTFAQFEQSMANVQAVSGATKAEFAALTDVAKTMGATTVFTARESAQALGFMSMAGLEAAQSIKALPSVLDLAAAGNLELADAADIVTNVMAGYGIAADDVSKATDVLVTGFTSANTDLQQLGEAFKLAGPVAKAAGLALKRLPLPSRSWATLVFKRRLPALGCEARLPGFSFLLAQRKRRLIASAFQRPTVVASCCHSGTSSVNSRE